MDLLAYDPASGYAEVYKEQFASAAEAYFDSAVEKAHIDPQANAELAAAIRKLQSRKESSSTKKGWWTFLLVLLIIALSVYAIYLFCNLSEEEKVFHWGIFILFALGAIALTIFKIAPAISRLKKELDQLKKELSEKYGAARTQLAPLYASFTWTTLTDLISSVIGPLKFDEFLSNELLRDLRENFGFSLEDEPDSTVTGAYSGTFYGYPFVFTEDISFAWTEKVWTGYLTITYNERITDLQGKTRYVTRTQILSATVTKPAPDFTKHRNFFFGHDSAPRLSFSRTPSSLSGGEGFWHGLSKKYQLRKLRKFEQNLTDESQYTMVANHDFEVLFRSENRDNEVEFRLLYTPLAQQYMVKLLNDKEAGYGDDFAYFKHGTITRIASRHLNGTSLSDPPFRSDNFDLKEIRKTFLENSAEFFRSIYFTFAPLFLVPEYNVPRLNSSEESDFSSISPSEIEGAAYCFGQHFAHGKSITDNIFNVSSYDCQEGVIHAVIEAIGFSGIEHVDYVPVWGGDGRWHNVPVPWVEYSEVVRHTPVEVWKEKELPPKKKPLFRRRGIAFVKG